MISLDDLAEDDERSEWNWRAILCACLAVAVCNLVVGCGEAKGRDPVLSDDDDFQPPKDTYDLVGFLQSGPDIMPVYKLRLDRRAL